MSVGGVMRKILVVDDKENMRKVLESAFVAKGLDVDTAAGGEEALRRLSSTGYDVVVTDLKMPRVDGMGVLREAKRACPETEVIVITAYGTIESAVEAMRLGAFDFVAKPFKLAEVETKVDRILRRKVPAGDNRRPADDSWLIVGDSAVTQRIVRFVRKVACARSSVLVTGESGTGKELVARAIHDCSDRRDGPFVAVNCAALAPGVLESELFGHEKGAFTGAIQAKPGRFEMANGGTLILDEIGDVDPSIQLKLLRVLELAEFERVGGTETLKTDARIVAATNCDLHERIRQGKFREDLFYRLNVLSIHIPPLRERRGDIEKLATYLMRRVARSAGRAPLEIMPDVMDAFRRYSWPGNIRELENCLERAMVLAESDVVTLREIPPELAGCPQSAAHSPVADKLATVTSEVELEMIKTALDRNRWNKSKAAQELGVKRTTLMYKIKKYGLE
jgi:DNA-binding NtrC family response regulator